MSDRPSLSLEDDVHTPVKKAAMIASLLSTDTTTQDRERYVAWAILDLLTEAMGNIDALVKQRDERPQAAPSAAVLTLHQRSPGSAGVVTCGDG